MSINNFSELVSLGITLSIGFIAVESVKTFTQTLSERLFGFVDFVEKAFSECKKALLDQATVDGILPAEVNGKSTTNELEQQKREHERLHNEIEKTVRTSKDDVYARCQVRSMSALCGYHAAIGVLILLLGAIEERYPILVAQTLIATSGMGLLYSSLGWILGERSFQYKFLAFSSLLHALTSALLTLVLSIILALVDHFVLHNKFYTVLAPGFLWFLFTISILPFTNFAVYGLKIRMKASTIKAQVNSKRDELTKECKMNTKELRKYQTFGEYNAPALSVRDVTPTDEKN